MRLNMGALPVQELISKNLYALAGTTTEWTLSLCHYTCLCTLLHWVVSFVVNSSSRCERIRCFGAKVIEQWTTGFAIAYACFHFAYDLFWLLFLLWITITSSGSLKTPRERHVRHVANFVFVVWHASCHFAIWFERGFRIGVCFFTVHVSKYEY